MKRVYVETYGCQMNEADSELVGGVLQQDGYVLERSPEQADAILINTCAVREHAEERVFGRIGELAKYKHERPEVIIGVLGCMAQHLKDKLIQRSRFVDIVAGPDSYRRLPEMLEQAATDRIVDVRLDRDEVYEGVSSVRTDGVTAWVTIQRGCDKCCSFCIVPAVRGRERCVPLQDVVTQVRALTESGVREVTLLGQTVNSYHDGDHDFPDLLTALAQIPDLCRIRFTSPYPTEFTDKLIGVIAAEEKIARHVHLPLQSANNRVLKDMRRRYTIEEFDAVLSKIRQAIPSVAVSTDLIVGFHGEGEEEFHDTCEYMRNACFDFAFMFKYSKRSQTAAWRWDEDVDEPTKGRRLQEIIAIQEAISKDLQQACVGKTVRVLVEGQSRKMDGQVFGRTSEFRQVIFPANGEAPGDLLDIRVVQATGHTLLGERIQARS